MHRNAGGIVRMLAPIAWLVIAVPAAAAGEVRLEASGHRVHVSIEKIHGGEHIINVVPDGESNLGDWVGDIELFVNGAHVVGSMTLTFESGDTLSVAFEQKWSPHVGEFGGTIGEFVVTGGTGRFSGARGGGSIVAEYLEKRFTVVVVELDGVVQLP